MRLCEIVGHDEVRDALVKANARGKVHHAYLFIGPEGIGKRQVAYGFAALVNCVGDAPEPRTRACGECRHCRRILAMAADPETQPHPDVVELSPEGRQIKIGQVRDILKVVPFPPIEANYRVVIIDPLDAMGDEAANALLKTLEEPPSRTRFIAISAHPGALLTTIRSRCQTVRFGRLSDADVRAALIRGKGVEPEVADRVVPIADGSVGAAAGLVDDPVMAARDELMVRVLSLEPGDVVGAFELAGWVNDLGGSRRTVFDLCERLYRDALMLRTGAEQRLFFEDLRPRIVAWSQRHGVGAILARLEVLAETRQGIRHYNLNPRLVLERLMLVLGAGPGAESERISVPRLAR